MRFLRQHNPLAMLARLNRDQDGTISIVSVFALLLLTMLLGMVMNVGRHVDGKVRMQNAADAAAYSGGTVLARGMNSLVFTNHMLSDVFALTAFLREGRGQKPEGQDCDSEMCSQYILNAWERIGPVFGSSGVEKFQRLGPAIQKKVALERELVRTYSEWAAANSELLLPLMETILQEQLIPEYQRAVVVAFPDIAQAAAMEIADLDGQPSHGRGKMLGVMWRASGQPVGGYGEFYSRTLPVVDPVMDLTYDQEAYLDKARKQRDYLANRYLSEWNNEAMYFFDVEGEMSQFSNLWRSFTCGYLKQLLEEEYPNTNMPHVIRTERNDVENDNAEMMESYTFLAVVYWKKLPEMMPGLFKNPTDADAQAFAQVRMFIPRRRLVWRWVGPSSYSYTDSRPIGAVPGEVADIGSGETVEGRGGEGDGYWIVGREALSEQWNMFNQRWTCQLVPATMPAIADILQTVPPIEEFGAAGLKVPSYGDLDSADIGRINTH